MGQAENLRRLNFPNNKPNYFKSMFWKNKNLLYDFCIDIMTYPLHMQHLTFADWPYSILSDGIYQKVHMSIAF